jgi:hypothetical protein
MIHLTMIHLTLIRATITRARKKPSRFRSIKEYAHGA